MLTEDARATVSDSLTLATVRLAAGGVANPAAASAVALANGLGRTFLPTRLALRLPMFLLGGIALVLTSMAAGPGEQSSPAVQRAGGPDRPKENPWIKTLPGGVVVELLGVKPHLVVGGPGGWFSPEGQPLPKATWKAPLIFIPPEDETEVLEFLLRVKTPAGEKPDYHWTFVPHGTLSSHSRRATTNRLEPDLLRIAEEFPRKLTQCTLRFRVATGPWRTRHRRLHRRRYASKREAGHPPWENARCRWQDRDHGLLPGFLDDDVRLVILDNDGTEYLPTSKVAESVGGLWLVEFGFDAPPRIGRTFRFQTRPYQEATFTNVALSLR